MRLWNIFERSFFSNWHQLIDFVWCCFSTSKIMMSNDAAQVFSHQTNCSHFWDFSFQFSPRIHPSLLFQFQIEERASVYSSTILTKCHVFIFTHHADSKIPAICLFLRNLDRRGWVYFSKTKIRREFFISDLYLLHSNMYYMKI